MINRRHLLGAGAALAAVPLRAAESIQFTRHANLAGAGLAPRHVDVWVPPDADDGRPLPLLLMHDGQNLFAPASAYGGKTWQVAETVMAGMAAGTLPPMIVAGVWNTGAQRWGDYVPAPLLAALPAELAGRLQQQGGGPSRSAAYVAFLADTVLPLLRQHYPLAPGRVTVMGSSMGGLASLNALMLRPDVFGGAGCLSTHWPVLAPTPADAPAISAGIASWLKTSLGPPKARKLWFDHGDQTLDQYYAPFQAGVDALLPRLGWQAGRDFASRAYPGAAHDEPSWAKRLADPLAFLFKGAA
jgi:enterochelin esterase-like enzyme